MTTTATNHLTSITARNRGSSFRTAIFTAAVALAAAFAVTTVSTAADAATPAHVTHR
ncbi:MAG: hypothetical protein ABJE66_04850 [Deltaproteobacteria bacterium]